MCDGERDSEEEHPCLAWCSLPSVGAELELGIGRVAFASAIET
jgi:hypothetical protein